MLTDEEKAGLSPEEIAAIEDETDEEKGATDEAGTDDKDESEKAETDSGDEPQKDEVAKETEDNPAETAGQEAEQEVAKTDAPAVEEQEDDDFYPSVPMRPVPSKTEIDKAQADFKSAKEKFDGGEISYDEYDKVKSAYDRLQWRAEEATEFNKSMVEHEWKSAQQMFFRQNPQYQRTVSLNAAFAHHVNALMATKEGAAMPSRKLLNEAKKLVESDLGILKTMDSSKPEPPKPDGKTKIIADAKKVKASTKNIPADLGAAPSAMDENGTDEFAYLDKLSGERFQAAVEQLTPAQRARYESM